MTNPKSQNHDPQSEAERQFEIDRICAEYADEVESGFKPDADAYLKRYPAYAAEIAEFIISYHLMYEHMPEPDAAVTAAFEPAFERALDMIRAEVEQRVADQAVAPAVAPQASLIGLADRAFDVGLDPERLAERAHISPSLIDQLDAHAIAASTIPRELFRRLAEMLDVSLEAVSGFLGASAQTGGAFYHASEAPSTKQDEFLAVIEASDDLDPAFKAEWRKISASEQNG
jgi:hypothetical protein